MTDLKQTCMFADEQPPKKLEEMYTLRVHQDDSENGYNLGPFAVDDAFDMKDSVLRGGAHSITLNGVRYYRDFFRDEE